MDTAPAGTCLGPPPVAGCAADIAAAAAAAAPGKAVAKAGSKRTFVLSPAKFNIEPPAAKRFASDAAPAAVPAGPVGAGLEIADSGIGGPALMGREAVKLPSAEAGAAAAEGAVSDDAAAAAGAAARERRVARASPFKTSSVWAVSSKKYAALDGFFPTVTVYS
jgi:hypothetical protein